MNIPVIDFQLCLSFKGSMRRLKIAMDEQQAAIAQWEKDNNIPTGYLGLGGPGGPRGGGMHRGGMMNDNGGEPNTN